MSGTNPSSSIGTLIVTDFTKAFDSVNHEVAIKNLLDLGAPPATVQWIVNFLTKRKQRVKYKQNFSDWQTLSCGVPQGTKLGPVIFLACINNAASSTRGSCWKYVDDLTLGECRHFNGVSHLQEDLNELNNWAMENLLSLNPSKCQTMQVYFGRREPPPTVYCISDFQLQQVSHVKLLGVILQNDLKWDSHIDDMIGKANRKLFMIRKLKQTGLTQKELVTVYKGYVRPILEYAAPVWHPGITQRQSNQVESVQKRVCRIVLGHQYVHYAHALSRLDLDQLSDRRISLCTNFATRTFKSGRFNDWYQKSKSSHSMTLRSSRVLEQQFCSTNRLKNSPIPYFTSLVNTCKTI